MRPKLVLWIAFSVLSSSWYLLDPAARPDNGELARAAVVEIEQIAQQPRVPEVRTELL